MLAENVGNYLRSLCFKTEAKPLPPSWDEGEHEAAVANYMMETVFKKQSKNPPEVDPMKAFTSEELGSLRTVHEHLIMSSLEKAKHDCSLMCPVVNRHFGIENFKLKHCAVVGENASQEAHAAMAAVRKKSGGKSHTSAMDRAKCSEGSH